jgi:ubiquinone/menaquinone biosynthesis C-methylase UbiE
MDHHHDHGHQPSDDEWAAMAELLDLDGEVLRSYLVDVTSWLQRLTEDEPPRRILDIGAGTGTGTLALAERFAGATLIAVDKSEQMLTRLQHKAQHLGLADRVQTVPADLDTAWPTIAPVDLAWASLSLHHLTSPDRVLDEILATIRPGGLLAVAEMEAPPTFLPDGLGIGRPGLESRCHDALAKEHAETLPHLGADWAPHLEQAGFKEVAKRVFAINLEPPHPPATGRFAWLYLQRIRPALADRLGADDLATLDTLLDSDAPDSVLHRSDLVVRGRRTVWIGRRP